MDPATCLRCLPHLSMVPAANSAVWNSLSLCPPEKVILQTSTEGSCPTMQVLRPRRVSQSLSCPTVLVLHPLPTVENNVLFVHVSLAPGTESDTGSGVLASASGTGYGG